MKFLRENFLKTYANIPIGLRDDIILNLDKKGPISWYTAYLEVKNNSKLSEEILDSLKELKLI